MEARTRAERRFARDRSVIIGPADDRRLTTEVDGPIIVGGGQPLRRAARKPKRGAGPGRIAPMVPGLYRALGDLFDAQDRYLAAQNTDPLVDAEVERAQERVMLAARNVTRAVDALLPECQPAGWADSDRQGGAR